MRLLCCCCCFIRISFSFFLLVLLNENVAVAVLDRLEAVIAGNGPGLRWLLLHDRYSSDGVSRRLVADQLRLLVVGSLKHRDATDRLGGRYLLHADRLGAQLLQSLRQHGNAANRLGGRLLYVLAARRQRDVLGAARVLRERLWLQLLLGDAEVGRERDESLVVVNGDRLTLGKVRVGVLLARDRAYRVRKCVSTICSDACTAHFFFF